jgi:hypothetical protein
VYNHELNEQWVEKLKKEVEGKKVLMVGNAASMFSKAYGKVIDKYDFIVRFGKGVPHPEFKAFLGTRTDLWFFGTSRAGMRDKFPDARYKLYTLSQIHLYKEKMGELAYHPDMAKGDFQVYRDFFLCGSANDVLECNRDINPDQVNARLSQGAQCIHWFDRKIGTYESIDLIGFDFFAQGFTYNYNTGKPHIPKVQPTTSWHCPLVSPQYEENPHNHNGNEENFIRSIPKLKVHDMPPINMERMEKVMKRLRGPKAVLQGE